MRSINLKLSIAFLTIILSSSKIHCQSSSETSLYNWFDNAIGKENLGVNNGTLHTNPYKTIEDSNMYFATDKFSKGDVNYDGQLYYDVDLKYDIYKDELILKPYGESEHLGINLIKEKTNSFSLNGKNFVNLNNDLAPHPDFINGYYETNQIGGNIIIYIKHHKFLQKRVKNDGLYYSFSDKTSFYLKRDQSFHEISAKKDFINIFPKYKKLINEYYRTNSEMKKSNKKQFAEGLVKHINHLTSKGAN